MADICKEIKFHLIKTTRLFGFSCHLFYSHSVVRPPKKYAVYDIKQQTK